MLDCKEIAELIKKGNAGTAAGLAVIPEPNIELIQKSGEASVSLRLGRWFLNLRQSTQPFFDVSDIGKGSLGDLKSAKKYFVPFGREYVLHPGRFVLASTLEWLQFPSTVGGYVTGKSTWARRGLVIETAAGIHPGFNGCLTLELSNVGEVPIKIRPGMAICQIFVHGVVGGTILSKGPLSGRRKPFLGSVKKDPILERLSQS